MFYVSYKNRSNFFLNSYFFFVFNIYVCYYQVSNIYHLSNPNAYGNMGIKIKRGMVITSNLFFFGTFFLRWAEVRKTISLVVKFAAVSYRIFHFILPTNRYFVLSNFYQIIDTTNTTVVINITIFVLVNV